MNATSSQLISQVVSSTGQLITDTIPLATLFLGGFIAVFGIFLLGSAIKDAGKKISRV